MCCVEQFIHCCISGSEIIWISSHLLFFHWTLMILLGGRDHISFILYFNALLIWNTQQLLITQRIMLKRYKNNVKSFNRLFAGKKMRKWKLTVSLGWDLSHTVQHVCRGTLMQPHTSVFTCVGVQSCIDLLLNASTDSFSSTFVSNQAQSRKWSASICSIFIMKNLQHYTIASQRIKLLLICIHQMV